ncbi:MAG: peptidoglycan-binding protein [Desulfamplus sp.]|nr:peptidoglycan-binding protein [Desulfamplus sp.]
MQNLSKVIKYFSVMSLISGLLLPSTNTYAGGYHYNSRNNYNNQNPSQNIKQTNVLTNASEQLSDHNHNYSNFIPRDDISLEGDRSSILYIKDPVPNFSSFKIEADIQHEDRREDKKKYKYIIPTNCMNSQEQNCNQILSQRIIKANEDIQNLEKQKVNYNRNMKMLQIVLSTTNDYHGEIDGVFNDSTQKAIASFQAKYKINPTGSLEKDTETIKEINNARIEIKEEAAVMSLFNLSSDLD